MTTREGIPLEISIKEMEMKTVFFMVVVLFTVWATAGLAAPASDVVLYYSFDEGTGSAVIDGSGNELNGTINGSPAWIDGVFGGALEFKGTVDEYIDIAGALSIGSGDSSIAMWIKIPENASGRVGVLLSNYPDKPGSSWEIHDDGQMRTWWNGGSPDLYSKTDMRDNEWHHIVFIREVEAGFSMYMDGQPEVVPEDASGDDINFTTKHRVGGDNRGDSSPWLKASVDDMVVFDRALTEAEISKLMGAEFDPAAISGAVLYYSFDEGSGAFVNDESKNGRDGTISGNPEWTDGVFSTALKFTGKVNEYVQINEILPIGTGSSTIAIWVKVPSDAAGRIGNVLGNYPDSPAANWELHDDGQMRIWWNNAKPDLYGTTDLRDDEWHHLAFIRDKDAGRFKMYIDGKVERIPGTAGGDDIEFATAHRIGGDRRGASSPWLKAALDDLVIYGRALTKAEMAALMTQPAIGLAAVRPDGKLASTWGSIKLK